MNETLNSMLNELTIVLDNLHFIRADWFYAFIPLCIFLWLSHKATLNNKNWHTVIDAQLLPFVLSKTNNKKRRYPLLLIFIAVSLCITALAGPVYKKLPQPVYREQSSLVVLLDLSQSMNAADIKPSRLSRAKFKLLDLLQTRKTGQTALVVYAADAFVVTPLTNDNATIANLIPSLQTDMMPAQGSNLSAALAKTFSLLSQAGAVNGDILVITDDIHQRDENAIKKVASQGHRLSIFGIGTTDGAPIPLDETLGGGFLQDSKGAIVIPKLQPDKLHRYALKASGSYTSLQADDSDIEKLSSLFQSSKIYPDKHDDNEQENNQGLSADIWQEEGHWLLLPLLFFAALWARKGWITAVLPFAILLVLPVTQPAHAQPANSNSSNSRSSNPSPSAYSIDMENLWSSPDQKAMKAFNAGDNENAASKFSNDEWKASALYRNGNFEAAAETLKDTKSSDGLYNKGNALAKLGKYKEAIESYDKALELKVDDEDTKYNLEQVKNALQQQKQEKGEDGDKSEQGDSEQEKSDQDDSEQQSDEESSDSKDSQQQDSQQKDSQQQDQSKEQPGDQESEQNSEQNRSPSSDSEQQEQEEEELKQRDAEAESKQQEEDKQQYEQSQKDQNKDQEEQSEDSDMDNSEADKDVENRDAEEKPAEIEVNPIEASITEQEKATEQWLKRIPDDPGGLLRRKFQYQYKRIPNQNDDKEPW